MRKETVGLKLWLRQGWWPSTQMRLTRLSIINNISNHYLLSLTLLHWVITKTQTLQTRQTRVSCQAKNAKWSNECLQCVAKTKKATDNLLNRMHSSKTSSYSSSSSITLRISTSNSLLSNTWTLSTNLSRHNSKPKNRFKTVTGPLMLSSNV